MRTLPQRRRRFCRYRPALYRRRIDPGAWPAR